MNISVVDAISALEKTVDEPKNGLPDDVFYIISSMTPLVNVDLLIRNQNGDVLLAWRDDEYAGTGWHLPGGIIRFKEKMEERIKKVALTEVGADVYYSKHPLVVREIMHETRMIRGHFISFLHECTLVKGGGINNREKNEKEAGFLKWHNEIPTNLLSCHIEYGRYF